MIENLKRFFDKFEGHGLLRRIFMCIIAIFFGITFVLIAPVFNTVAVTVIFYCFGCVLFVAFNIAAWVDYVENG